MCKRLWDPQVQLRGLFSDSLLAEIPSPGHQTGNNAGSMQSNCFQRPLRRLRLYPYMFATEGPLEEGRMQSSLSPILPLKEEDNKEVELTA